jgi:hypothetical protein
MATGPWHFQQAERLLDMAGNADRDPHDEPRLVWMANVHATLAHAAATALRLDMPAADSDAWIKAASAMGPGE